MRSRARGSSASARLSSTLDIPNSSVARASKSKAGAGWPLSPTLSVMLREHRQQRVRGMALITLSMAQNMELPLRKTEFHRLKQAGLDARGRNRGGDGRGAQTCFNRRPHRLVRWQFQLDTQLTEVHAQIG